MSTDKNIRGKIVILTGAAGGIGREIASHLAKEGATLVLGDIDAKALEEVAKQVRAQGGQALAHAMNLRNPDEVAGLVEAALDAFGRIDILINNAGLGYFEWIEEMPGERLREQFEVNVLGPAELIRQVVPVMKAQRSGHIINVASYASRLSAPPMTVYSSTKYAVEGLTDGLRRELEPWRIHVTRVHPDAVKTQFNAKAAQHGGVNYPFSELTGVKPEDVAHEVVKAIKNPSRSVFVSRIKFLSHAAFWVNRLIPSLIDRAMRRNVRKMWREHEDHSLPDDLVVVRRRRQA